LALDDEEEEAAMLAQLDSSFAFGVFILLRLAAVCGAKQWTVAWG